MKATRQSFGEAIAQLGEKHPEIVVLDADLSKSTKSEIFAKKFPERFYEMGIAEMNMIGTAAGLAFAGKIPFACSFGCFLTGRYDTIRLSVAYANAGVKLVGTHAGVGIGDDGHSQMGLEDIALMRALPTMGVFQPADARETEWLVEKLVTEWKGPAYLRLTRQNLPDLIPRDARLTLGKVFDLGLTGADAAVCAFATGATLAEAVGAAKALSSKGVKVRVINVHSLKPFDVKGCLDALRGTSLVVSVEDHTVLGGLGTCVAEAMAESGGTQPPLVRLGVQDLFGESGEGPELYDKHGISARTIAERVDAELRKRR